MLLHEQTAWSQGYLTLAGVDEAGRGPLAGPVVAAAVAMPREFLEAEEAGIFAGLTDSKQLSATRREAFFALLTTDSRVAFGIASTTAREIDEINILRATHLAMRRAVEAMGSAVDLLLVDGRPVPGLPFESRAIVKGDARSQSIAAASILAKVSRDRLMAEYDGVYPRYGFAAHKGYGTRQHYEAIRTLGLCEIHRRSFLKGLL